MWSIYTFLTSDWHQILIVKEKMSGLCREIHLLTKWRFCFIPQSFYKCTRHSLNTFRSCFKTDYWYSDPQLSWRILSISCLKGWRQPSSSMHHKPELIANQSNKLQLISKPISNFSCSSCLHLLRGKMWDEGKWFLVNIYDFFFHSGNKDALVKTFQAGTYPN